MEDRLKDYETVKTRKKKFYEKYKDGRIIVECIKADENMAMFKATLYKSIEDQRKEMPLSTGFAMEFKGQGGFANKHAWVENCEESAIGRATDNAGFATKCSQEEMKKVVVAEKSQEIKNNQDDIKKVTYDQLKRMYAIMKEHNWSHQKVKELSKNLFNINSSTELTQSMYDQLCDKIQNT